MKPWHGIDGHVMADLMVENMASRERWGPQDHPLGIQPDANTADWERQAKQICQAAAVAGDCTWRHIIEEEFAEFLNASSEERAYQELIQLSNVAFLAAESYRRARRVAFENQQKLARGQRAEIVDTAGGVL